MAKRKTTNEFIKESIIIHNSKYEYSLVNYINAKTKVKIICPKHSMFYQTPNSHLNGAGCSVCSNNKNMNNSIFVKRSNKIHNNKYDYSYIDYINNSTKVKIVCSKHGDFLQTPGKHLQGQGCSDCWYDKRKTIFNHNNNIFIKRSKKIHNEYYSYDLVRYKNSSTKVKIICPKHGEFIQAPSKHLSGSGCMKCGTERTNKSKTLSNADFIKKSKLIHNNKYDYSLVKYLGTYEKVKIICQKHGEFEQAPSNHIGKGNQCGCPMCNSSKGEKEVNNILTKNNIEFIEQKTFGDLKSNKNYKLRFDFYLPKYNTCIEYDGKQHYKIVEYFGGRSEFMKRKHRDKLKNQYCKDNNIRLIRIPYTDFNNIEEILKKYVK